MTKESLLRLRQNIEHTGHYEPLIVRPFPQSVGRYQIIHGHNRYRVLKALGHQTASCIIWDITDEETRLYLATVNRLTGNEIPECRVMLLEFLLQHYSSDQLTLFVPDSQFVLDELKKLASLTIEDLNPLSNESTDVSPVQVILSFMLNDEEARIINLAIDVLIEKTHRQLSRGQALVEIAKRSLDSQ
jgi:hypothetical protein